MYDSYEQCRLKQPLKAVDSAVCVCVCVCVCSEQRRQKSAQGAVTHIGVLRAVTGTTSQTAAMKTDLLYSNV